MSRFLQLILICILFSAIIPLLGWLLRLDFSKEALTYTDYEVSQAVQAREDMSDITNPVAIYREVDYSEGSKGDWYPKRESPYLDNMLQDGGLPPLIERIGVEPAVVEGVQGIGKYGGTWLQAVASIEESSIAGQRMPGVTLVRWSPHGYPIVPHLAKSWSHSEDYCEWVFDIRKGIKWSDGQPLTVEDFIYWWEDEINSDVLNLPMPRWIRMEDGSMPQIDKVGANSIRFRFQAPNPNLLIKIAGSFGEFPVPKHYLRLYHPNLGNAQFIQRELQRENMTTVTELYNYKKRLLNPEHPRLWAWVPQSEASVGTQVFERNPYYWGVDSSGNQLPYIDRIIFNVKNAKLIPVAASNGEVTMQAGNYLQFKDYTLLIAQRKQFNYQVYHWFPASRSVWTLFPNINKRVTKGDRTGFLKRELLNERRFRQALSLAINRKEIIESVYQGIGEPSQLAPGPLSKYHHERLYDSFVEYNPSRANRYLDELGLTKYDNEGYRCFWNGRRMVWFIDYTRATGEGPIQFIIDGWKSIGVRAIARENSGSSMSVKRQTYDYEFYVHRGASEFDPITDIRNFVPIAYDAFYAPSFGDWYSRGGYFASEEMPIETGTVPPQDNPLRRCMELYNKMLSASDFEKRKSYLDQIFDIHADNTFTINIASPPPQLVIVDEHLRNVPDNAIYGFRYRSPGNAGVETFYFDETSTDLNYHAATSNSNLMRPSERYALKNKYNTKTRKIINYTVLLVFTALVCWIIAKYPFIRKRLLIMIPQLFIISFAVFYIIQIPPGSYVERRILELSESGIGQAAQDEIESLKKDFHLDEPTILQYARWAGLYWFTSFESSDRGLLQGFLGRSMKDRRTVGSLAGDRVLLTLAISLGAIVLTWTLAIPIGILAASKQHTFTDYFLSFFGLIGLSIPNFLFVLILIFISNKYLGISVTGMSSVEYLGASEWSISRILDILTHLWVPMLVLGISGTAGMMRIMRGNLLDELRKPYVTTAKSKGLKPVPCTLKYPLRVAINPFISGIGGILPALLSGGAIVAIVMGLPTIGPLLLESIMDEDVYVAASLLMMINILAIIGVLISDLLLMVLDPRIRMDARQ